MRQTDCVQITFANLCPSRPGNPEREPVLSNEAPWRQTVDGSFYLARQLMGPQTVLV